MERKIAERIYFIVEQGMMPAGTTLASFIVGDLQSGHIGWRRGNDSWALSSGMSHRTLIAPRGGVIPLKVQFQCQLRIRTRYSTVLDLAHA
jgi:hypothetical protein